MITEFLISMLSGLVSGLFLLVPQWSIDTSSIETVESVGASIGGMNGWIPESFILGCLALILAVRLWFLVWNGVQWLYHSIPFNG